MQPVSLSATRQMGFSPGAPITEAVQQVFEAAGDEVDFYRHELLCSTEALARLRARANDESETEPSRRVYRSDWQSTLAVRASARTGQKVLCC